ncbi:MAG TPA: carboxypeptidase regulatory-like domain-containing protein, partial [Acidobacteriaceae bacterium]|nr:carboxypeptidase regulatory-like domain-containing protein [Acidobacteriaceae bacterium]
HPRSTHPAVATSANPHASSLPVTHVSLYKNGVGFIEHTGRLTGDAAVTIDFTSAQLNDVLQTLTAIDLNGGRISGAGYNSTTPLDQQLKTLPLSLPENPSAADFYKALRGARVEVRSGSTSITGRLLSVEYRDTNQPAGTDGAMAQREFLTVVSDAGDSRTFELTPSTSVRLLDTQLHADLARYLQLIDSNRSDGLRHLTLLDKAPTHAPGPRELRVSYLSEVPVWKSTYRILFTSSGTSSTSPQATLQGWSVVDNTTGTDWNNIQLSLIAGAPQSFLQPISQPIYSRRPEIPIAQEAQLTPQTHDSSLEAANDRSPGLHGRVTDPTGAAVSNATITVTSEDTGQQSSQTSDSSGFFFFPLSSGQYRLEAAAPGFQRLIRPVSINGPQTPALNLTLPLGSATETVEVAEGVRNRKFAGGTPGGILGGMPVNGRGIGPGFGGNLGGAVLANQPYEQLAATSITPSATTAAFDDFFAYNLTDPITIRKNESALVPILQAKVTADRVTLVSSNGYSTSQPLRALWITNTSGLTLDRGSFTVVENGSFGGEGLLDPIHPDEKRLLSYAADQAIHVATEDQHNNSQVVRISAAKGVLTLLRAETRELTFAVHNAAPDARTVVLEYPVENGFKLDPSVTPTETTATAYRFRLATPAGGTVRLHVAGRRDNASIFHLSNSDENQLTIILNQAGNDPALIQALQPILQARRRVADAQAALNATNTRLTQLRSDEDRQRANITALKDADKSARDRFVRDLTSTEDNITATQTELSTRTSALESARTELSTRIEQLQLDQTL